jgi:hypothetical protein
MVWLARALLFAVPSLLAGPALGAEPLPALERLTERVYQELVAESEGVPSYETMPPAAP